MPNKDFWDLTNRPYTRLKLKIVKEYLWFWATIFFSQAKKNPGWESYKILYYVDCFAGRGKYHFGGKKDIIDGSPLISLQCALEFQEKYKGIKMKCIFVELSRKIVAELENFCKKYEGKVEFEIYRQKDFNKIIPEILDKINHHPTFFFIDPDGIKEVNKRSIEQIVARSDKAATDILFNYIKGGVERIVGLVKSKKHEDLEKMISIKNLKTIKRLTDFCGTDIFKRLDSTEKQRLKEWVESILRGGALEHVAVFDMPYSHKSDNIYYLLFASRKEVAKKVMLSIFKKAKKKTYKGQITLDIFNFEL